MKIYIKNMVCKGTKLFVRHELERLGLHYRKFELGEIDFEEDLSSDEIRNIDMALRKYGLEVLFGNSKLISNIRSTIVDMIDKETPFQTSFSYFISKRIGYNYTYLNRYFLKMTGLPIEEYYIEKRNEKESLKEQSWSDTFISLGINA